MSSKNKFNYFIQLLTSENTESIKINTLILLEQEYTIIDDKTKTTAIFKLLDNLYSTDSSSTPLLKGQILLTTTTLLILLNTKDKHIHIFTNFINNILLEIIKNTNNHSNAYLRETACKCLEELENEYPGILFSILGKKTLLLFENDMNEHNSSSSMTVQGNNNVNNSNNNNNALSLHSPPLSSTNKRSNVIVNKDIALNNVNEGNGNGDIKYEKRRKELIDGGLYSLLEEEMHGVFQHYLLLYTVVLRDMIQFYVEQFKYLNNEGFKSFKMQKELESNNNNNSNSNSKGNESECNNEDKEGSNDNMSVSSQEEQNKEIENKVYWYITHNPLIDDNTCNSNTLLIDNNNNNNNSKQNPIPFSKVNYNSLSIPLSTISSTLHINEHLYNRYIFLYEIFSSSNSTNNNNTDTNQSTINFPQKLSFFIKQAFCRIDNFLPKTNEIIKTKIWKLLTYIISHTEINQSALIPEFNYFHLNCNSCILSLLTIDIINYFDNSKIKCNFFLKLVIKLCLLIKDHRLNTNLRIIVLRWLINLRKNKSIKLNFAKYLQNISYELVPSPFDYLSLINEKLKSLFIFFTEVNEHNQNGSSFILNSVSIMDSYKYYSIFSNYIKSLFRTYLFIIVRYPYKNIIIKLSETLKNNIKEVPRTLPYVINLLRIVKNFAKLDEDTNKSSNSSNTVITVVNDSNSNNTSQKMLFKHINELLLLELSGFLKEFRSHAKLKKYLELLLEIAKSNEIPPTNIITSLNNLYTSIKDLRDWKTEKNIIEICKVILIHHDLNIVKQNNLQKLLYDLSTCSFDYGIREKAKLYYELVIHTEKAILLDYLDFNSKTLESNLNISQIHIEYDFNDVSDEMKELICLEQSVKERRELNIDDRGTAIFDCELHTMMQLLSSPFYDKTYTRYTDLLLTPPLNEDDKMNYRVMNDYLSRSELNDVINNHIDGSDILRLFIKDDKINDINNSSIIDETKVFDFSNNVISSTCGVSVSVNDSGNCSFDVFMKNYINNIKECRFYIKLPVNVSLAPRKEGMNCKRLFSLCLCFCSIPELDIQSPVLIPFLSQNDNNSSSSSNNSNKVYPYYYKFYLVIYPKLPIPSEIKSRAVCFNDKAHCNTGIIQSLYVKFEDYFLPITIPLLSNNNTTTTNTPTTNTVSNDISPDIKENIFNYFWKHFKELNIVNTNRTFNLPKAKVTSLIKQKLFPFLINQHYLQTTYHIPNPYTTTTHSNPSTSSHTIIKSYFNITTEQYNNNDYDFSLDAYINPKKHDNTIIYGEYNLAKVLIFIPKQYHMLFKIKISSLSTIIYIRSDCEDILEYLDDYFDSWDEECSLCNKLELPFNNENDMS